MGGSSSKPARKLVKEAASSTPLRQSGGNSASRPIKAGQASVPNTQRRETYGDQQERKHQLRSDEPLKTTGLRGAEASETKTQAVMDDARDPHLMANLQKLGQVQVPRGKVHFQPQNPMLNILSARQKDSDLEREANESTTTISSSDGKRVEGQNMLKNRMPISTIVALLDARKECKTQEDLKEVARGFDIDVNLMEQLARYVNAPSVDAADRIRQQNQGMRVEDGDDALERIEAIWTEPSLETTKRIQA